MTDKKEREMREDISSYLSKKEYYDILGVAKTASDMEIKKAYRSLAMRFHPDKNKYQGAKIVFNKISNAYTTLIDSEKRSHYDRFGPEQARPAPQYQYRRQAYAGQQDYEFQEFDDIFRAFFGGGQLHRHRQANQQANNNVGQRGGFAFYYIFIIFFVIYTIAPLFQSKPNYSTYATGEYRFRRTTPLFNVEYFVNQKYFQEAKNPVYKRQVQMIIDREYLSQLEATCENNKRTKRRIEQYAYRERPGSRRDSYFAQAKNIDQTSCRLLREIHMQFEDYVRDLTYMR